MTGGSILHNTVSADGGGIYCDTGSSTVDLSDTAVISGNTAAGNGGGVGIDYADLANLTVGPDVVFSGNKAASAYSRNPADDTLYYTNIEGTQWTTPFTQGYNNVDIQYTNGTRIFFDVDVSLKAQKTAIGGPLVADEFEFGVFDNTNTLLVSAFNDAYGRVLFPPVTFGAPGTYNLTIREISASGGGWIIDDTIIPVTVTVTDVGNGQLVATVSYPSA